MVVHAQRSSWNRIGLLLVTGLAISAVSAQAGIADFRTLYRELGFDRTEDYFGATADQILALDAYKGTEDPIYGEINGYLRFHPAPYEWYGTSPEAAREMVASIDGVFERMPTLPAGLILVRGITLKWRGERSYEIGEEYVDRAYVSTSTTLKVAEHFADGTGGDREHPSRGAILTLYFNQPGQKAILFDQGEDEVMLPHGLRFRVMSRKIAGPRDQYLVQVCGRHPCATEIRDPALEPWWNGFVGP